MGCSVSMDDTRAFNPQHGRNACYFDCHTQFLPEDHPYPRNKKGFTKNHVEYKVACPRLIGDPIRDWVADTSPAIEIPSTLRLGYELELDERRPNTMPKAAYTLMREQKKRSIPELNYTDNELFKCHYWGPNAEDNLFQLTYPFILNLHIVLFKCRWVDLIRGMKAHPRYHLVDENFKTVYQKDEPFILAQQAVLVYYIEYSSMKRDKADWMAICKTNGRRDVDESQWTDIAYQQEKVVPVPDVATNNQTYDLHNPYGIQIVVDLSIAHQ
ncbi:UNVERIFIED_CONTAM: hypothetical protein Sangu_1568000 [Sesamum angustifolium]|uniref:DUF4216 domain-containing protein n=1 Tax=Sesamum angustifolium TaxID=2727405 RepID=A0AAW2MU86_9LAMI